MTAGLRVLEGPDVGGVGPGDVFVVDDGDSVHVAEDRVAVGPELRFVACARFVDGAWQAEGGRTVRAGRSVYELVDDVGFGAGARVVGGVVALRLRSRGGVRDVEWSNWTGVDRDGAVNELQLFSTGQSSRRQLARGVALERFGHIHAVLTRSRTRGTVPAAIAGALIDGATTSWGTVIACYDGVVRSCPPPWGEPAPPRHRHELLQDVLWLRSRHQARQVEKETRARASVDEVAAFVRSFDAAGWQRHQAFIDELAIWTALPSTRALFS